jgi:hypothetical protein
MQNVYAQELRYVLQCNVKNGTSVQSNTEREAVRRRLTELRGAILRLHKALLESDRVGYEQTFGKIGSPYQFLQLLTTDPWFAWLHPMSQLIIAMDEMLDAKEALTLAGLDALVVEAKALLTPTVGGEGFSRHYDEALQRDPDVVFAHAAAAKLIRTQVNGAAARQLPPVPNI